LALSVVRLGGEELLFTRWLRFSKPGSPSQAERGLPQICADQRRVYFAFKDAEKYETITIKNLLNFAKISGR
jgi:hypothetical protein